MTYAEAYKSQDPTYKALITSYEDLCFDIEAGLEEGDGSMLPEADTWPIFLKVVSEAAAETGSSIVSAAEMFSDDGAPFPWWLFTS